MVETVNEAALTGAECEQFIIVKRAHLFEFSSCGRFAVYIDRNSRVVLDGCNNDGIPSRALHLYSHLPLRVLSNLLQSGSVLDTAASLQNFSFDFDLVNELSSKVVVEALSIGTINSIERNELERVLRR